MPDNATFEFPKIYNAFIQHPFFSIRVFTTDLDVKFSINLFPVIKP